MVICIWVGKLQPKTPPTLEKWQAPLPVHNPLLGVGKKMPDLVCRSWSCWSALPRKAASTAYFLVCRAGWSCCDSIWAWRFNWLLPTPYSPVSFIALWLSLVSLYIWSPYGKKFSSAVQKSHNHCMSAFLSSMPRVLITPHQDPSPKKRGNFDSSQQLNFCHPGRFLHFLVV